MEKFTIGLAIGGVCGALIVANSCKMRTLVKKGQDELKQKLETMMDEKLKEVSQNGGLDNTASPSAASQNTASQNTASQGDGAAQ
jgi:hypothetical protein